MSNVGRPVADPHLGRGSRNRQRQRLIDACISALHVHGPSRTTVEKVVAIANLSPGIVRFYFRSKAAMMVASLQYLATEFDEKLLVPVTALRDTPVEAMRRLVELYLDPELASPRKISVWYAFWGEATARQEYYEICGQKDDSFVALVRDLMGRLTALCPGRSLDVEALSLAFIGLLEVLWQGFAFQIEADIDRAAARERCMAYLRSIFPDQFGTGPAAAASPSGGALVATPRPAPVLPRAAAQLIAHEQELAAPGDAVAFVAGDVPLVVVRGADGGLGCFENRCRHAPHELLPEGRHRGLRAFVCRAHGREWGLDGRSRQATGEGADLAAHSVRAVNGLVFSVPGDGSGESLLSLVSALPRLEPVAGVAVFDVRAPWSLVAEHWLDVWFGAGALPRLGIVADTPSLEVDEAHARWRWTVRVEGAAGPWSLARFAALARDLGETDWVREFIAPGTLYERHAGGIHVTTVTPLDADRCRIARRGFMPRAVDPRRAALAGLAARLARPWLREDVAIVESLARSARTGLSGYGDEPAAAVAAFRAYLRRAH